MKSDNWIHIKPSFDTKDPALTAHDIINMQQDFINDMRLDPQRTHLRSTGERTTDATLFQHIQSTDSPILVAHDGGAIQGYTPTQTRSLAGVALSLHSKRIPITNPYTKDWHQQSVQPLILRATLLPNQVGMIITGCDHGELMAQCMADELLIPSLPVVYVADSQVVRGNSLRDVIRHGPIADKSYANIYLEYPSRSQTDYQQAHNPGRK